MTEIGTRARQSLARLAIGVAVAGFAMIGLAKADTDGIINTSKVPCRRAFSAAAASGRQG